MRAFCFSMAMVWAVAVSAELPVTVEDLASAYPDRLAAVIGSIDTTQPGLEAVRHAEETGDTIGACKALLAYYRNAGSEPVPVDRPGGRVAAADQSLADTFTFYEVTGTVPRLAGGGLDWNYLGPSQDKEWAWALNRFHGIAPLLQAWRATGEAKYAQAWNDTVKDWVLANPYPGKKNVTIPWRGLEVFFRVKRMAEGFNALQQAPELDDAARLLILSSIPDHADYLRRFHASTSNWICMELNGLATAAVTWPEFRASTAWLDYSVERLQRELTGQVYPDGVQHELTSHYHWVTLRNFEEFAEVVRGGGHVLPGPWDETITAMHEYLARTIRPDGFGLLNNDSDRDNNRRRVIAAAERYDRPEWRYIATNGVEGTVPEGPPSAVFPWAGQLVMRDGYGADAQWAFFDAGPLGSGHWHRDKLHLSVAAYGRDILVDGGRYTYVGGPWREYFKGTESHNTVLIDGKRQNEYKRVGDVSLDDHFVTEAGFDGGYGIFDGGYDGHGGKATHERAVYYNRGAWWLVLDRVTLEQPATITALWNFHPECTVITEGNAVASTDVDKGNVRIVPSEDASWDLRMARGEEEPAILGWYSRKYNIKEPMTTAVYEREAVGEVVFAWLILPAKGVPGDGTVVVSRGDDGAYRCEVRVGSERQTVGVTLDTPLRILAR